MVGIVLATVHTMTLLAEYEKVPAPENLAVPPYSFLNDTTIKIG